MEAILQELKKNSAAKPIGDGSAAPSGTETALRRFGFFVEDAQPSDDTPPPRGDQRPSKRKWLECPGDEVAYLRLSEGQPPQIVVDPPERAADAVAIEPLYHQGRPLLLMRRPGREIRVNGLPAPRVAVLRVGDRLTFGDTCVLHLSLFTRPYVGPVPEEHVDATCPYCRLGYSANSVVYVCPRCRNAMHCAADGEPGQESLECARLANECPCCHAPVVMTEEFAYVPD